MRNLHPLSLTLTIALTLLPSLAHADWATDAELDRNRRHRQAHENYRHGLAENNKERSISFLLTALSLARESKRGKIDIYEVLKRRQGVRTRYLLRHKKTYTYTPELWIFKHFDGLLAQSAQRAARLPEPRRNLDVRKAFDKNTKLLAKLRRHNLAESKLAAAEQRLEQSILKLITKKSSAKNSNDTDPSQTDSAEDLAKAKAKAQAKARAAKLAAQKLEQQKLAEAQAQAERLRVLEQNLALTRLRSQVENSRRALRRGQMDSAVATVTSALIVVKTLKRLSRPKDMKRADIALVMSETWSAQRATMNMAALLEVENQGLCHKNARETFKAGAKSAKTYGATRWLRRQEQKMALALISTEQRTGRQTPDIRKWLKIFEDSLAKELLKVDIEDAILEASARGQGIQGPLAKHQRSQRVRLLAAIERARIVAEESWVSRQQTASAEDRHEMMRQLLKSYEDLRKQRPQQYPSKGLKRRVEKALAALCEEMGALPFTIFKDGGEPVRRLASYLALLPELERVLAQRSLARVQMALGLGALDKAGDQAAIWLVDRALETDRKVLESLPKQVPDWLLDQARARRDGRRRR